MSRIEDTGRAYLTALDKADPAAAAAVFSTDARVVPDETPHHHRRGRRSRATSGPCT